LPLSAANTASRDRKLKIETTIIRVISLGVALLISGCITLDRGDYFFRIRSSAGNNAEVSGLMHISPFLDWKNTEYGESPRTLVENIIRKEFSELRYPDLEIRELRVQAMQNNYIAYSASVSIVNYSVRLELQEKHGEFPVSRIKR